MNLLDTIDRSRKGRYERSELKDRYDWYPHPTSPCVWGGVFQIPGLEGLEIRGPGLQARVEEGLDLVQ
ncbi:unnamed protein product [Aspergillus oryzae]|nr:unnamed protein product [Aspergillus oryzae]GMF85151.1 unnamed protein product [Aspergillus oryzae]GMG05832.1 unnamed protein product [Aspergillus oryzae]